MNEHRQSAPYRRQDPLADDKLCLVLDVTGIAIRGLWSPAALTPVGDHFSDGTGSRSVPSGVSAAGFARYCRFALLVRSAAGAADNELSTLGHVRGRSEQPSAADAQNAVAVTGNDRRPTHTPRVT